jgi:hypothetical protein
MFAPGFYLRTPTHPNSCAPVPTFTPHRACSSPAPPPTNACYRKRSISLLAPMPPLSPSASALLAPGGEACLLLLLLRRDLHGRRPCTRTDHRAEVFAVTVLRPIGVIDTVVDRAFHHFESYFFRHPCRGDPPRFLPHGSPIPARVLPVIRADVEGRRIPRRTRSMSACRTLLHRRERAQYADHPAPRFCVVRVLTMSS